MASSGLETTEVFKAEVHIVTPSYIDLKWVREKGKGYSFILPLLSPTPNTLIHHFFEFFFFLFNLMYMKPFA